MKTKIIVCTIILVAILAAALFLRFGGVTHERIYDKVADESDEIQEKIDVRYHALDQKLDRIEGKLDRIDVKLDRIDGSLDKILEMANRPLPDNLQPARP